MGLALGLLSYQVPFPELLSCSQDRDLYKAISHCTRAKLCPKSPPLCPSRCITMTAAIAEVRKNPQAAAAEVGKIRMTAAKEFSGPGLLCDLLTI